jgi:hypothetical protein
MNVQPLNRSGESFITVVEILGYHFGNRPPRRLYISVRDNSLNQQRKRIPYSEGLSGVASHLEIPQWEDGLPTEIGQQQQRKYDKHNEILNKSKTEFKSSRRRGNAKERHKGQKTKYKTGRSSVWKFWLTRAQVQQHHL